MIIEYFFLVSRDIVLYLTLIGVPLWFDALFHVGRDVCRPSLIKKSTERDAKDWYVLYNLSGRPVNMRQRKSRPFLPFFFLLLLLLLLLDMLTSSIESDATMLPRRRPLHYLCTDVRAGRHRSSRNGTEKKRGRAGPTTILLTLPMDRFDDRKTKGKITTRRETLQFFFLLFVVSCLFLKCWWWEKRCGLDINIRGSAQQQEQQRDWDDSMWELLHYLLDCVCVCLCVFVCVRTVRWVDDCVVLAVLPISWCAESV